MSDNKLCKKCKTEKPLKEFFVYSCSGRKYNWCVTCMRNTMKDQYHTHGEKAKQFRQRWGRA